MKERQLFTPKPRMGTIMSQPKPNAVLEGRNIKSIAKYFTSVDGDKKRKIVVLVRSIFDRRH
jgi:hypothetical protein